MLREGPKPRTWPTPGGTTAWRRRQPCRQVQGTVGAGAAARPPRLPLCLRQESGVCLGRARAGSPGLKAVSKAGSGEEALEREACLREALSPPLAALTCQTGLSLLLPGHRGPRGQPGTEFQELPCAGAPRKGPRSA